MTDEEMCAVVDEALDRIAPSEIMRTLRIPSLSNEGDGWVRAETLSSFNAMPAIRFRRALETLQAEGLVEWNEFNEWRALNILEAIAKASFE